MADVTLDKNEEELVREWGVTFLKWPKLLTCDGIVRVLFYFIFPFRAVDDEHGTLNFANG